MCGSQCIRHLTDVVMCVIVNWQLLCALGVVGWGNAKSTGPSNLQNFEKERDI